MASRVNIVKVEILDNPAKFTDKFKLEIEFEVFEQLPHDLEWELVYVGSGTSRDFDQVLDSALVGPIPEGRHKFVFDANHPNISKIPVDDIVGVSVLLLRCKYNDQEFINMLNRKVETEDPRLTTFPIRWTDEDPITAPVEEDDRVFAEEDLMPLNDEGQEEDDDEDEGDDEMEEATEGEIDLDQSFNENMVNVLDGGVATTQKEGGQQMDEEAGNNYVEMGDDEPGLQINSDNAKTTPATVVEPLSDKTNSEMIQ